MSSKYQALRQRLLKATAKRGMKGKLAKDLRVPLPRLSEWLRGVYEPGAEITLLMLDWVGAEEDNQQKNRSSATNTATAKTRKPLNGYEKKQPGRKKK